MTRIDPKAPPCRWDPAIPKWGAYYCTLEAHDARQRLVTPLARETVELCLLFVQLCLILVIRQGLGQVDGRQGAFPLDGGRRQPGCGDRALSLGP
jgi:hypothetical protein